jgi:glucose/arabinose dehydrogenase
LESIGNGFDRPVLLTSAADGSGRKFVVEQAGRIQVLDGGAMLPSLFLDLTDRVTFGGERGLLGLAFHPKFAENGRFFVNYTRQISGQLKTLVSEFQIFANNPDLADPDSETIILEFDQPYNNHNAGMLAFGPDGFLYIATGDGGRGGDPQGNGQNISNLLGKILRIDVDRGDPYAVPEDNPFVGLQDARGEIWAYGLRNPWRFSFDSSTGRIFAGDVGQSSWEEIDLIVKGGNYGWNTMEGTHCFSPSTGCDTSGLELPIAELDRSESEAVTGGYVYRGDQPTPLWGSYIFGDYRTGNIWYLTEAPGGHWERHLLLETSWLISSFGEDEAGELYLVDYTGEILKLVFSMRTLFAHAADGMVGGDRFRSRVILVNNDDEEVNGLLRFFDQNGDPQVLTINADSGSEFSFVIPPRTSRVFRTSGGTEPLYVGWAEAQTDRPVSGVLHYVLEDASGKPLGEAGVQASTPSRKMTAPVSRDLVNTIDTGVALVNPSSSVSSEVTVIVNSDTGQKLLEKEIQLNPGEHVSLFVSEMGALPDLFEGTILIDSPSEVVATLIRTVGGVQSASLPFAE